MTAEFPPIQPTRIAADAFTSPTLCDQPIASTVNRAIPYPTTSADGSSIRIRARDGVRPWAQGMSISCADLAFDRLRIRITAAVHYTSRAALADWLGQMGSTIPSLLGVRDAGPNGRRLRVGGPGGVRDFQITGEGGITGIGNDCGAGFLWLDLDLNANRWLAHWPDSLVNLIAADPVDSLRRRPEVAARTKAVTLDGADNFMPSPAAVFGTTFGQTREDRRDAFMATYLGHVLGVVDAQFRPVNGVDLHWRPVIVQQVEAALEIATADPLAWLQQWSTFAKHAAAHTTIIPYQTSVDGNAFTVRQQLRTGVYLSSYVKSLDCGRVRLEVAYHDMGASLPNPARGNRSRAGSLVDQLNQAADDAAARINVMLSSFSRFTEINDAGPTNDHIDLMSIIMCATGGDAGMTKQVIRLLSLDGRILDDGQIVPKTVTAALLQAKVLADYRTDLRRRGPARLALTGPWVAALTDLSMAREAGLEARAAIRRAQASAGSVTVLATHSGQ